MGPVGVARRPCSRQTSLTTSARGRGERSRTNRGRGPAHGTRISSTDERKPGAGQVPISGSPARESLQRDRGRRSCGSRGAKWRFHLGSAFVAVRLPARSRSQRRGNRPCGSAVPLSGPRFRSANAAPCTALLSRQRCRATILAGACRGKQELHGSLNRSPNPANEGGRAAVSYLVGCDGKRLRALHSRRIRVSSRVRVRAGS